MFSDAPSIEKWLSTRKSDEMPSSRLAPGEKVGEWRVTAFLGAGLSAEVYRVTNLRYGQEGALKLLVDSTRGLKERFQTEADALRFLSIPAVPRFMGAGEHKGAPYYVMEYLHPLPEPMKRSDVAAFMIRLAKAVQKLHDAGYIHRDLKPGNVMLRQGGEPVLIDLGLVKKRGTRSTGMGVRHGNGISLIDGKPVGVGTLDYAAPEQLLKGEASVESDVFSLGKMLRALYDGHVPANVKGTIRRATRDVPSDRYRSAADFAKALRARNRPLYVSGAVFLLVASLLAAFPALKPVAAKWLGSVLKQQQSELVVAQKPEESDEAYFRRIMPLAGKGDVVAQMAVAEAYFYGRGTATNRAEAVVWYTKAAESGEADAQASLALCLFRGWGCQRDINAAASWWAKAAEKGNLGAINDLAFCHMHGFGVEKDTGKAFALAMSAAERGHAPSQTMVGECYLDGRGVERDIERAETWLYRAARQGNKRAQMLLRTR